MALLLCIETATERCSIGLSLDGVLLALKNSEQPYSHTARITLLIDDCLKSAGQKMEAIDAVAVSSGPGSYTALRVGTAVAKGICFARDLPLLSVDTLQSLALASVRESDGPQNAYFPMIDARRMEVYAALFDREGRRKEDTRSIILTEDSLQPYFDVGDTLVFSGNGAHKAKQVVRTSKAVFRPIICDAEHLIPLAHEAFQQGNFEDLAYYAPLYLKPPNITKPRKRL